mgnify:FL=1
MMKRVLILNGSFCEEPIIKKAKEMEYYVITTGNAPDLEGHQFANEYIPCDYSNKEAVLQLVKDNNIEGIISCANDFGVLTAAWVCEQMGWKGHDTYENAVLMHHKDKFKQYCKEHNIPSPISTVFTDKSVAVNFCETAEYPIIIKANDLTGGKGINRANNFEEARIALDTAFEMSRDKHIVVEPFIEGTQHTFATFVIDKKVVASTSCNCYSPINPYLIQSETFPADSIDRHREELIQIVENMCQDLNLANGIFALQYMMKDDRVYIIEMMRRPFGNDFLTLCSLTTGFDMVEGHIRSQLNLSCQELIDRKHNPEMKYCGHHGIMADRNGYVLGYQMPEDIARHVYRSVDMIRDGEPLLIDDYTKERVAYIYYQYSNRDEMNAAVARFNERISVQYEG